MRNWKRPLALAPMLMLMSCASSGKVNSTPIPMGHGGIDPLCYTLKIIALSHADTSETKTQVIAQNKLIKAACPADVVGTR